MIISFDAFNKARIPSLVLCNPNGDKLFSMKLAKDRQLSVRLNELSELTFTVPKYKDETLIPYYDYLITRRYVEIDKIGRFVITNVKTEDNGLSEYKEVTCNGLEIEMASKNMGLMEGTYKFYDPSSNDKSLMNIILSYLPNWSIGEIEDDLWNIYRTFDIKDNNVYNFLMTEVQEAYKCIFIIDTFNRTISAKTVSSIIKPTDIFMSSRNLIKNLNITEDANDIKTALDIYGDGDLSIHSVNPLGTATLYDFSYYKNVPDMMSNDLVAAITKWEDKLSSYQEEYSDLLTDIKNINANIISLKSQLTDLESELFELEEEEGMKMVGKEDLTDVHNRINDKKLSIERKKEEVKAKETELNVKKDRTKTISADLKFEKNFTSNELSELTTYIIQATHQCTNFAVTDTMTDIEKQEVMQDLMEYGKDQLASVSQPTYRFDIDCVNFLRLFEYKYVIEQLELGCEITICVDRKKDRYAKVMLLGYDINLDDATDLELHFSNKLKFGGDKYKWEELFNTTNSISTTVDFESPSWGKAEQANSKIDEYINNALDLAQQSIISSDNQEFTLTHQGLRGREWDDVNKRYLPEQIWMTKNVLAFSDDGFSGRPRMAIGKILLPDGTYGYGLNGEVLVGNITITKKLIVENENHSFKVDGNSILIKNANIIMTNDEGQDETLAELLSKGGDTSSLMGDILAGKNNIICSNSLTGRVLALNENGIIVGTMGADGVINPEGTFITKDGINADYINSGKIKGVTIIGGNENGVHTLISPGMPLKVKRGSNGIVAELWAHEVGGGSYLRLYGLEDLEGSEPKIELRSGGTFSNLNANKTSLDVNVTAYAGEKESGCMNINIDREFMVKKDGKMYIGVAGNNVCYFGQSGCQTYIDGDVYLENPKSRNLSEIEVRNMELQYDLKKQALMQSELEVKLMERGVL